ncbi:MAG TPA: CBS domain-containing protein [Acidimicrobiales bacterium]|nr:CBS domain-containing protein [Acidimicrobiales bacterium]
MSITLADRAHELIRPPVVVAENEPLTGVAHTLWQESVGAVIVGTAAKPAGILTERDLVAALGRGADPTSVTATDVMTSPIVAVRPDDPLLDVAYLMFDDVIRHVPVIDDLGRVTGIVSVRDLLRPLLIDALSS